MVVVNEDGSQLSRQLEFMADATAQVKLVARAGSLDEARQMMLTGKASGICTFPPLLSGSDAGQERDPGLCRDASYFLVYGTIAEGLAQAGARSPPR